MNQLGKSILELDEQDYADFINEIPTNRCGEGGCRSCDEAYRASCEPITALPKTSVVMALEPWEADTIPDGLPFDPPDVDPYSTVGHDWSVEFDQGGEG
jgi:hypothetical protein